jgi:two-component system, chemotaxis family, chemotaxis protein CheY
MKSFLVVDDSRVIRNVARRILEAFGFKIEEAADGQLALDACKRAMPDWNMPVMNGIEFLRALRATPGGNAPIVLFCTTETDMSKIQQAIEAGANEYIMKPFDSEIVESKLLQVGLL